MNLHRVVLNDRENTDYVVGERLFNDFTVTNIEWYMDDVLNIVKVTKSDGKSITIPYHSVLLMFE